MQVEGRSAEYTRISDEGDRGSSISAPTVAGRCSYFLPGEDDVLAIPVGAFADPTFPAPVRSVYESRRHEWVAVPADERWD